MGWWAGENLMDVAIYINDARALQLTLIGGQTGAEVEGHDWEHILTMTNSLHLDHRIANITQFAGAAVMIGCLAWAAAITLENEGRVMAERKTLMQSWRPPWRCRSRR